MERRLTEARLLAESEVSDRPGSAPRRPGLAGGKASGLRPFGHGLPRAARWQRSLTTEVRRTQTGRSLQIPEPP